MKKLTDYLYRLGHWRLGFIGHHAMVGPISEHANGVLQSAARYPDLEELVTSIRLMIGRRIAGLAAIVSEMEPELIDELNEAGFR